MPNLYMEKLLSSCLSHGLFVTLLPEKTARAGQLLNLTGNDYVTRCRAKNVMRKSHRISPTNWYQLFTQETASLSTSEGQAGSATN